MSRSCASPYKTRPQKLEGQLLSAASMSVRCSELHASLLTDVLLKVQPVASRRRRAWISFHTSFFCCCWFFFNLKLSSFPLPHSCIPLPLSSPRVRTGGSSSHGIRRAECLPPKSPCKDLGAASPRPGSQRAFSAGRPHRPPFGWGPTAPMEEVAKLLEGTSTPEKPQKYRWDFRSSPRPVPWSSARCAPHARHRTKRLQKKEEDDK